MTATFNFMARPNGGSKPFILVMTESRTYDDRGLPVEDEPKIFRVRDVLFTMAGEAPAVYRGWLHEQMLKDADNDVEVLLKKVHDTNINNANNIDLKVIMLACGFKPDGKPEMWGSYIGSKEDIQLLGPIEIQEDKDHVFMVSGTAPQETVDLLTQELKSKTTSLEHAIKCGTEHINRIAKINPKYCNTVIQKQIIYFED